MGLSTSSGQFKVKTLNRTHLSEMYEMFEDILKIREESHLLMVANGKLIKYTGDLNSEPMLALVGMAVRRKMLPFLTTETSKDEILLLKAGQDHTSIVSIVGKAD